MILDPGTALLLGLGLVIIGLVARAARFVRQLPGVGKRRHERGSR